MGSGFWVGDAPASLTARWRVCAKGGWHPIEGVADARVEDGVFINVYARIVDIQWNVNDASSGAIFAVAEWLLYDRAIRESVVALGYHYGAPNNEVYDTPMQAAGRILEIAEFSDTAPFVGTMRKRLMLERAFSAQPDTRDLIECWLRLGGELRPLESQALCAIMPKTLLFRHVANDDSFIFAHVGADALSTRVMGDIWSGRVIGRRADDCFSDDDYEAEVCADYSPVMARDEGRFHHLRAVIDVPGRGPGWYNYERLSLPWTTPSGERVLMVHSAASQTLDIPFLSRSG